MINCDTLITPQVIFPSISIFVAIVVGGRAIYLKAQISLKGKFSIASDSECNDQYVSSITIENLKDRAVVIFKIYIRIGYSIYIELENLEGEPLILKPFEVLQRKYSPIMQYSYSIQRVDLNNLFENERIEKKIILSTNFGRYVVKSFMKYWDPIFLFSKNSYVNILDVHRKDYKGEYYGENILYLIDVIQLDGKNKIIKVKEGDENLRKFYNFQLTKGSLKSAKSLKKYLFNLRKLKKIDFKSLDVIEWRKKEIEFPIVKLGSPSFIQYYIFGRIERYLENYRIKKFNRKSS